ncbi:hypothetical protein I5677_08900 [Mobilitalea sibirica]|uniref:Flagellar hook-length control protein FliK n=1 Tax=Mobilitalea sibirica TaxID=1462919 RepID=A0A8J7KWW7_9FIRM|nr:DUF6240 domain-containing protein [Mobilitalea sibirica]MBH1941007.1 hypothetical protein [Mobilitalea sibirica]
MEQQILGAGKGLKADKKQDFIQNTYSGSDNKSGLTSLKKGQQITGVITAIGDTITLSIGGQMILAKGKLPSDTVPGESKVFQVLNVSDRQLELGIVDYDKSGKEGQGPMAVMKLDLDQEVFLTRMDYTGKQAEQEKEFLLMKQKINEILSKMTELDYQSLEKEGFPVESFTIEGLYTALNRIKNSHDNMSLDKSIDSNQFTDQYIKEFLEKANLPVTKEMIHKISTALSLSEAISQINEKAIKFLISTEQAPTIENIYRALYSQNASNTGHNKTLSEQDWKELIPQVKEALEAAGYDITEENMGRAKWLIENQLPLTGHSLDYLNNLKSISGQIDKAEILQRIVEGVKSGIAPKDIVLLQKPRKDIEQLIKDIHSIEEDTIGEAIKESLELTIRKLVAYQKTIKEPEKHENKNSHPPRSGEAIKAQRQLEEIRLKMTAEAAQRLESRGFHIETQRLERVVTELRKLEDEYYRELLIEADLEADQEQIRVLRETTHHMERFKLLPSYILGKTLSGRVTQTVPGLLDNGEKLMAELSRANEAYETLMTVPNREYGDSIQKAFSHTDQMLKEMELETTLLNQRAVRILGYNGMEITKESIEKIKAYDLEVQTLIKNLQPQITVRMVKDGFNPLHLSIGELNQTIDKIKSEMGSLPEEKYATYLRKLEKEESISQEERKAYIGIYRLLHAVEKTDGAALGALIKAEREVTLSHLLTAVRTLRTGSMDAKIDDGFGSLQSITYKNETITEQLEAVFSEQGSTDIMRGNDQAVGLYPKEQIEILHTMLKQMKEDITPGGLNEARNRIAGSSQDINSSVLEFIPEISSGKGIWEAIKDIPIEKLFDRLPTPEGMEDDPVYIQKLQELRQIYKNSDQAMRFLEDYKIPSTTVNVMLAKQMLSDGGTLFKKLQNQDSEKIIDESLSKSLKKIEELSDTIFDRKTLMNAYDDLEKNVDNLIERELQTGPVEQIKLTELKSMRAQMSFIRTLARKEYYQIPVNTQSGVTNINLTIVRNNHATNKVSVTMQSDYLGSIKAELTLKKNTVKGYISSDNRKGLELLQDHSIEIENIIKENKVTLKQLSYCLQQNKKDTYAYQNPEENGHEETVSSETERVLYGIAKGLILTVRAAELAGADKDRAAS